MLSAITCTVSTLVWLFYVYCTIYAQCLLFFKGVLLHQPISSKNIFNINVVLYHLLDLCQSRLLQYNISCYFFLYDKIICVLGMNNIMLK